MLLHQVDQGSATSGDSIEMQCVTHCISLLRGFFGSSQKQCLPVHAALSQRALYTSGHPTFRDRNRFYALRTGTLRRASHSLHHHTMEGVAAKTDTVTTTVPAPTDAAPAPATAADTAAATTDATHGPAKKATPPPASLSELFLKEFAFEHHLNLHQANRDQYVCMMLLLVQQGLIMTQATKVRTPPSFISYSYTNPTSRSAFCARSGRTRSTTSPTTSSRCTRRSLVSPSC